MPVARPLLWSLIVPILIVTFSCNSGGGNTTPDVGKPVITTVAPSSDRLEPGATVTLTATVEGSEPTSWEWDLADAGTIIGDANRRTIEVQLGANKGVFASRVRGCGILGCSSWKEFEIRVLPQPLAFRSVPVRTSGAFEMNLIQGGYTLPAPLVLSDGRIVVRYEGNITEGTRARGLAISRTANPVSGADWDAVELPEISKFCIPFELEDRIAILTDEGIKTQVWVARSARPFFASDFDRWSLPDNPADNPVTSASRPLVTPNGLAILRDISGFPAFQPQVLWSRRLPAPAPEDWAIANIPTSLAGGRRLFVTGSRFALIVDNSKLRCGVSQSLQPEPSDPWVSHTLPGSGSVLIDTEQYGSQLAALVQTPSGPITGTLQIILSRVETPASESDWRRSWVRKDFNISELHRLVSSEIGPMVEGFQIAAGLHGVIFQSGWSLYEPLRADPRQSADWIKLAPTGLENFGKTGFMTVYRVGDKTRYVMPHVRPGLFLAIAETPAEP